MEVTVALLIVLAAYFLPFIIALLRSHRQTAAIFVLNLFLGWTLVGWVVALAMSVSNPTDGTRTIIVTNSPTVSAGSTPEEAPHEHQWIDSETTHRQTGAVIQARRCTSCGFIEAKRPEPEKHQHSWGEPLPSGKYKGRLYQRCSGCKADRYID